MEDGAREAERWEGYVDWRNRPATKGRHGGMLAASFVLVVEVLENLAFLANASNLVTYLMGFMHYTPSQSATTVTNFMGTAFLLALLGGFLSDAFFTTYAIYLVSAFVEFMCTGTAQRARVGPEWFQPVAGGPASGGSTVVLWWLPGLAESPGETLGPPGDSDPTNASMLGVDSLLDSISFRRKLPGNRAAFTLAIGMEAGIVTEGLVILTIQARTPSLMPPHCDKSSPTTASCSPVSGAKKAMLFAGLYLTALGVGGIKGSLPSHGAEQFDEHHPRGRKSRSTFFNYFVFCLSCGALVAVTFAVWVEDNKGWQWGFGISTIAILLSIPVFVSGSALYRNKVPTGSPLTTIAKVLLAAVLSRRGESASNGAVIDRAPSPTGSADINKDYCNNNNNNKTGDIDDVAPSEPSGELAFLNRAVTGQQQQQSGSGSGSGHLLLACSVQEVEDVKIVLMVLPIFFSTIMLNCCLAQLSTFSVEQAATMDTRVGNLRVPPASLPVFPVTFIILLAPVYDHAIVPFARRLTRTEMGISHLQRIGTGLVLSVLAMAVAAVVEVKRKHVAADAGMLDSTKPLPITFFWIAFQYLFLGSADLFTLAGLLDATGRGGHAPWLHGASLNHYRLERFYWLMCVLSALNYLFFLFWAIRYKYRNTGGVKG
ncbi:hypothetical protein PR202_gb27772 [Eleusine coracana subsp. coracana]|uniref:Uncharacterized protein n=1 Tax=Eleusine coracana subsp. coracana TaxID=191504 RepID=A0AAV5FVF8_ELECO|nr:hypothetical protein PR202_gb27772 [Eleusine coracana subsp. coracana]